MPLTELRERGADLDRLKSDKARRFALEFALDKKPAAAAIRAGYSKRSAPQIAAKLLKNPAIKAYLGKLERLDVEKLHLDREEVLLQLYYLVTRSGADVFDKRGILVLNHRVVNGKVQGSTIHDLPERAQQAIDGVKQKVKTYELGNGTVVEEIETELKMVSKAAALDMAMKHKGLFQPDKSEVKHTLDWSGLFGKPIEEGDPIEQQINQVLDVKSKAIEGGK